MAAYIATFCVATFLFKAAEKIKRGQRAILEYAAIFLLCLLAGLRSIDVGTDTEFYFQPCIKAALSADSLKDYFSATWYYGWRYIRLLQYEQGFLLAVYGLAKILGSVAGVQFGIQLLIILPVYATLKRRKDIPLWLGMLTYCLVFYNWSLNAVRQAVAVSFVLLFAQAWIEKDKKKSILWLIIGCTFHISALLGILIVAIYQFVQTERKTAPSVIGIQINPRNGNMIIVILAGFGVLLGAGVLVAILKLTPLARFAGYISGQIRFMPNQLIKLLPPTVILLANFKRLEEKTGQARFFLSILILTVILLQFTSVNSFGGRIADYFMVFGVVSYPLVCEASKRPKATTLIMVGYLAFYWFFYFGYGNGGETVPYETLWG